MSTGSGKAQNIVREVKMIRTSVRIKLAFCLLCVVHLSLPS